VVGMMEVGSDLDLGEEAPLTLDGPQLGA
jgi:hypothetical protein